MPKVQYAEFGETQDNFKKLTDKLDENVDDLGKQIEKVGENLQGSINKLAEQLTSDANTAANDSRRVEQDSKAFTDQSIKSLREEAYKRMDETTKTQLAALEKKLGQSIAETGSKAHEHTNEGLRVVGLELVSFVNELKSEIAQLRESTHAELEKQCIQLRDDFTKQIQDLKKETVAAREEMKQSFEASLENLRLTQKAKDEDQDQENARMDREANKRIDDCIEQIKSSAALAQSNLEEAVAALNAQDEKQLQQSETHLSELDEEADKLRNVISEVENTYTKKVDWVIVDASKQIASKSSSSQCRSWFSPRFTVSGAKDLQLELRHFRSSDPLSKEDEGGDTAVFLWACKGISLVYRLYVGNKYHTCEKVFTGRVPHGTKRFCFLSDQIKLADDTLTISLEVLEAHRVLDRIVDKPGSDQLAPNGVEAESPLESTIHFHRNVNNRLNEQVKNQVDLMRSRMVKRVEWRVEQASKLRGCFPPGECICSARFMAAGIDGFQLLLYPSGYKGATDGMCSLFVYGPAGCSLKGALSLGTQRRETNHFFEDSGACGRTNFCTFNKVINEADDTVMVVFEVDEASLDMVGNVNHSTTASGPTTINSVIKLSQTPCKQGLNHASVLPSLWTVAMKDSADLPVDGMRSFEELKKGRPPPKGDRASPTSPASGKGIRMSRSTPSLTDPPSADNEVTMTLPPVAQMSGSGSDCGSTSARRRQRQRQTGGR
jgi:hypothetical protein